MTKREKQSFLIKLQKWGKLEIPIGVRWAVFVIFVTLWLLWFSGYFGF